MIRKPRRLLYVESFTPRSRPDASEYGAERKTALLQINAANADFSKPTTVTYLDEMRRLNMIRKDVEKIYTVIILFAPNSCWTSTAMMDKIGCWLDEVEHRCMKLLPFPCPLAVVGRFRDSRRTSPTSWRDLGRT
jgi:hypothetical protein